MKYHTKIFYLISTIILLISILPLAGFMIGSKVNLKKSDNQLILDLIENESNAWWQKDFEGWSECWAHADYIRTQGWWEEGGITIVKGWTERSKKTKQLMLEYPEKSSQTTTRDDWNIRIMGDMAWATFRQYGENTSKDRMEMPGISHETRIFEKHEGKWKIVYVGWLLEK